MSHALRQLLFGALALLVQVIPALAQGCPEGTYFIYEDEENIYCKREHEGIGDSHATRAAILKSAMAKLGYPYHKVNTDTGESRCLAGDVAMCPTHEHPGGCYDCSALVYAVLKSVGQPVKPGADKQYAYFKSIPGGLKHENPMYGDVIFFVSKSGVWHTGIYVGSRDGRVYYLNARGKDEGVTVSIARNRPLAYGNVSVLKMGKPSW